MDKWIKIGLKIARPHIVIVVLETLIAIALLIYSSLCLQPSDILSIVSYVLSFYALVIVCFRIPDMIKFFKHIRNDIFTEIIIGIEVFFVFGQIALHGHPQELRADGPSQLSDRAIVLAKLFENRHQVSLLHPGGKSLGVVGKYQDVVVAGPACLGRRDGHSFGLQALGDGVERSQPLGD